MSYQLPSPSTRVTSTFDDHTDRTPPSTQPGTDYGVGYGSPCYAPSAGKVTELRTGTGPSTDGQGRFISILFDDGREGRALHLDRVDVTVGQRVSRGQQIGLTGASGFGSNYYYGAHVHQTLWRGRAWSTPEVDFEAYVGAPLPPPDEEEDEEMPTMKGAYYKRASDGATVYMLFNEASGWWTIHTGGSGSYNNAISVSWATNAWASISESHALSIQRALDAVKVSSGASPQLADADAGDDHD